MILWMVAKDMMPTSIQTTYKNKNDHGFSLMEIMVALLLISIIFLAIPTTNPVSFRAKLEVAMDDFDRAIRFASDESVLRNGVTRIKINLDSQPPTYAVEYSTKPNLTLPKFDVDIRKMSIREREEMQKLKRKISSQFSKVSEFSDDDKEISEDISLLGVATSSRNQLIESGEAYIYFFPTGEKDAAALFFGTPYEVASLSVGAFRDKTFTEFYVFSDAELVNLEQSQENKVNELYEQWLKSND
jgi:prepilin-type N-terminal cleavage/methylation domain-containing protein